MAKVVVTADYGYAREYLRSIENKYYISILKDIQMSSCLLRDYERTYILLSDVLDEDIFNYDNVIQACSKIDKRTRFYKKHKKEIVILKTMTTDKLIEYVQSKGIAKAAELVNKANGNLGIIQQEISKPNLTTAHNYAEDAIFDLVTALVKNTDSSAIIHYLNDCMEINEHPLVIIQVLSQQCTEVLQLQSTVTRDIINETGLTNAWVRDRASKLTGYRDNDELLTIIDMCYTLDRSIKQGSIDAQHALMQLIINIV